MLKIIMLSVVLFAAVVLYLLYRGVRSFVENHDEVEVKKHTDDGWFFRKP